MSHPLTPRLGVVSQPADCFPSAFHCRLPGEAGVTAGATLDRGPDWAEGAITRGERLVGARLMAALSSRW